MRAISVKNRRFVLVAAVALLTGLAVTAFAQSCPSAATVYTPSNGSVFDYNAYVYVTGWESPNSIQVVIVAMEGSSVIQNAPSTQTSPQGTFSGTLTPPKTSPTSPYHAWPTDVQIIVAPYCNPNTYNGTMISFVSET